MPVIILSARRQQSDLQARIVRESHSFKGTAGTIGLDRIGMCAAEAEALAKAPSPDAWRVQVLLAEIRALAAGE